MSLLWLAAFGFRAVAASESVSTEARSSPPRSCAEVQGQPERITLFDVPHDGNCLFSAVALSVAIVDDAPAQTRARAVRTAAARLRTAAMDLLCPHGSPDPELSFGGLPVPLLIEPRGGESESGYCRRLRTAGEWGSTAELLALTRVLRRPIRVCTSFGTETYGDGEAAEGTQPAPLCVHYDSGHYQAAIERLRGGSSEPSQGAADCEAAATIEEAAEEAAVTAVRDALQAASPAPNPSPNPDPNPHPAPAPAPTPDQVLDAMHAASSRADNEAYLSLFAPGAVFLGTDPAERWAGDEFREYAAARFRAGNGWAYDVQRRSVVVRGDVAWFDESLRSAKLGACRGSGVLLRGGEGWRIAQYNLMMAIPNHAALEVAALAGRRDTVE